MFGLKSIQRLPSVIIGSRILSPKSTLKSRKDISSLPNSQLLQIAVIDTANDEISPFPFSFFFPAGIRADNPNSDLFDGVQFLAIRPGKPGVDFEGADIFYTTGISSKLGSVNTALVLPPQ